METVTSLRKKHPRWFRQSKLFGDLGYKVRTAASGAAFLVQHTTAWTDMFDGIKKPHYRLHILEGNQIGDLLPDIFQSRNQVTDWLAAH